MTQVFDTDWGVKIELTKGDITRLEVDCIVNAANSRMLGGGGVDGAIHRAAGDRLLEACRKVPWNPKTKDRCPTGEARLTKGPFNQRLYATDVIHTVGPIMGRNDDMNVGAKELASCIRECLKIAKSEDYQSIAFPAISCGIFNNIGDDWSVQAAFCNISTCVEFIKEHSEGAKKGDLNLRRIVFIFNDQDLYDFWEAACVGVLTGGGGGKDAAGMTVLGNAAVQEEKGEEKEGDGSSSNGGDNTKKTGEDNQEDAVKEEPAPTASQVNAIPMEVSDATSNISPVDSEDHVSSPSGSEANVPTPPLDFTPLTAITFGLIPEKDSEVTEAKDSEKAV
eukprot:gene24098-30401_t